MTEANAPLAVSRRLLHTYMEEVAAKVASRRRVVGERIREARESKGWLQKELAARVHVEPQTVSNWERGVTAPDLDKLEIIARELGRDVAYFVTEPEAESARDDELHALREELAEVRGMVAQLLDQQPAQPARKARRRSA